jgi:hypothetical protein
MDHNWIMAHPFREGGSGTLLSHVPPTHLQCEECDAGTYGWGPLESTWDCTGCGGGRYSNVAGASKEDVCMACPAGKASILMRADTVSFFLLFLGLQLVFL